MENEEFVKKTYQSIVQGPNRRGKLLGRWEDRVKAVVGTANRKVSFTN